MNIEQFRDKLSSALPVGKELDNPGGGISTIKPVANDKLRYQRGASTITVRLTDLFVAYSKFTGQSVSCSDLKIFQPSVFDSNARPSGHSCNCTIFFLALKEMGVIKKIQGAGVRGDPYYTNIAK